MWFKNLLIYKLTREINLETEALEKQLADFAFTPCGSQDIVKFGWVPAIATTDSMLHTSGNQIMLRAKREQKIIPSAVITEAVNARVSKLEAEQQRRALKVERVTIRDEVIHTLLPRAFSKSIQTLLWIDSSTNLIFIDTGSHQGAEDVLALLRKTIGSLPVVPLTVKKPIELTLTEWVRSGEVPSGFTLLENAELKSVLDDGATIQCKKQDLSSEEIASHIDAQKLVTKLAMDWQNHITFTLCESGAIKRLKFADELREQNDDIDRDDLAARIDADFLLMTAELGAMVKQLNDALDGAVE